MKKTPIISSFHVLPILLLTISLPSINCDLVDQICKKTPFYDLCISTLRSNSNNSAESSDVKGLASVAADILLSNATDTLNYIQSQISQTSDPQMERALAYCAELYIPVVKYNLPQAIEALSKGKFEFASDGISDAAKQADACEKNFSGSLNSPLSDRNKLLHSLSDVAVAIVKLLLKG
ncbi:Pectinesterase inhibitor [Corchorus capsularis]|uniref:Pectinesterase inhibitor n=1 Tax=Corchorus capsularis TaxID=210143 RepID=A0A1R3G5V9_COCAP|nr:Pectinesterase inhibitor [Corchorus capsularis]